MTRCRYMKSFLAEDSHTHLSYISNIVTDIITSMGWWRNIPGSTIKGLYCSWHIRNLNCSYTLYPKKYAHGFVVLCFVVVMQSFIMNSHEVFIHIHQGCFAGTGAIVRLPQCQWSKPDGYGKISQCITTTKHSKAKTVCIFLGIYCISPISHHLDRWIRNWYNWYKINVIWLPFWFVDLHFLTQVKVVLITVKLKYVNGLLFILFRLCLKSKRFIYQQPSGFLYWFAEGHG